MNINSRTFCRYRLPLTHFVLVVTLSFWNLAAAIGQMSEEDFKRGEQIYASSCADCHGKDAGGVDGIYDSPLTGDLPVSELSKYVEETMPEGDAESCVGADADLVTAYLFQAFYSREAQLRNNPPEIEFSRRTVVQYQNAIRDIVKTFRGKGWLDDERGFKAKYFDSRKIGRDEPAIERIDPQIDFDFANGTPDAEKISNSEEFAMVFRGGLIIKETGTYKFIVTSNNGFWLNVNGGDDLIDNKVNSSDENEFHASIKLDAGEIFPIELSMIKFNDETANVKLEWVTPSGIRQVIPASVVSPKWFHPMMVFETKFPADDSSVGYVRGTRISDQWDVATTQAAMETMNFFDQELESILRDKFGRLKKWKEAMTDAMVAKDHERHVKFANKFVKAAFGRTLTEDEIEFFIERQFAVAKNDRQAIKRVVLLTLKSPQFLYLTCFEKDPTQSDVANRLATVMWDSIPDNKLLEAAEKNELQTRDLVAKAAWRMLYEGRTRQKLSEFFHHWLEMEKASQAAKDGDVYPGFGRELIQSLKASIDLSLEDIVWSDTPDFRQLMLFDKIYIDQRMADFYGIEKSTDERFEKVSFESDRRSGILTHPYLMTGLAYYKNTSPIHRGVFVAKNLLGRSLKPPPIDVEPLDEAFDPTMTTRERVAHQTKEINCVGCHSVINPLGFSLENFDAVGRFRGKEKDKPIDSKTVYLTPKFEEVTFNGAKDLASYLVSSPEVHRNFIEQMFQHFVKQPIYAFGPNVLDQMEQNFVQSNYNVQRLIVEIAVVAATHDLADHANEKIDEVEITEAD